MINFDIKALDQELAKGILELRECYHYTTDENKEGIKLSAVQKKGTDIKVDCENNIATIEYDEKIHFFRAFSLLLQDLQAGKTTIHLTEKPQFTMNGAMFDVSQGNAVMNVDCIKNVLRRMAMMGLNMLMMYCEDSFDVPEEPYFGYMRARYSEEDLRMCDEYADMFGIEMIPCIQTLAHLIDVLKWQTFNDIKEDNETLFVGYDKTYVFIENLIKAAMKPFKTKRIHIGMDEAWRLGLGTYLAEHGLVPTKDIMREHLAKVMEIINKLGLEPMMWSDMFFRAYTDKGYYDPDVQIPKEAAALVPDGVSLVYWDYYSAEEAHYDSFIEKHTVFGKPIFAGGIWTWTGFAANWGLTFNTTHPALMSCKKNNINEVFVTIWGDNGTECNIYANLMGLSLFAEHGYSYEFDEQKFRERFEFCTGAKFDDFYDMRLLDEVPGTKKDNMEQCNPSKFLMWQDILTGMFDYNIDGLSLNEHYEKLAETFKIASTRNGEYNSLFEFNYHVANVLAVKSEIGLKITKAYKNNDRASLQEYAQKVLPDLSKRVSALRKCHKRNWFNMNKAIGFDIMDMRYGSLLIRIQSAIEEIEDYLNGNLKNIEELEENRLPYNSIEGLVPYANFYGEIVSASRIAPKA